MSFFGLSVRQTRCVQRLRCPQWQPPAAIQPLARGFQTDSAGGFGDKDLEALQTSGALDMASILAAPELRLSTIKYARPLPVSPSYFSRTPQFNDELVKVQSLVTRYMDLPTGTSSEAPRIAWKNLEDYRAYTGEEVKASHFGRALSLAKRLSIIHPDVAPREVAEALEVWAKDINPFGNKPKVIPIDRFGRAVGVGKRKEAVARAWLVEGTGEVLINGKTLSEAFGRVHDRESAVWALFSTDRLDKYNVWALVEGGGPTGQAEAMTMAVAKALLAHEPALKPALRRAGCITRDPREVERKKPGHLKARKMPAWVKR